MDQIVADAAARGVDTAGLLPLLACEPETLRANFDHLHERHLTVADDFAGRS